MHNIFNNLHYVIFDTTETGSVNFTEVTQNHNAFKSRFGL